MKVQPITQHEQNPVQMEGASGARMRMLCGPADGAANFHMRHFEVQPGGHTPHHQHDYEHEILILKGAGVAQSEQGERRFGAHPLNETTYLSARDPCAQEYSQVDLPNPCGAAGVPSEQARQATLQPPGAPIPGSPRGRQVSV